MAGIVAVVERDDTLLGDLEHVSNSRLSLRQSGPEEADATQPDDNPGESGKKGNPPLIAQVPNVGILAVNNATITDLAESGKKGNPPLVSQGTNAGTLAVNNATITDLEDNRVDTFSQSEHGRGEEEKDTDPIDNLDAGTLAWNSATTSMLDNSRTDTSRQPEREESEEVEDIAEDIITDVSGRRGTNLWEARRTVRISPNEDLHPTTQVEDDLIGTSNFHERNNQVPENYDNHQLGQNAANESVPENSNNHNFGQHYFNDPEPEYYNEFLEPVHENSNDHNFGHDLNGPEPEYHSEFLEPVHGNSNNHNFGQHYFNEPEHVYDNDSHHFGHLDTNVPELELYNEFLIWNHDIIEPMLEYAII